MWLTFSEASVPLEQVITLNVQRSEAHDGKTPIKVALLILLVFICIDDS